MESLYNIEQNLIDVFTQLEENGGELTEELANKLEINQDNFVTKLTKYADYINSLTKDIEACKAEKKRVDDIAKVRANRVERLKSLMLSAVVIFGQMSKTGVSFIELPTYRLSTRNSSNIEVNEERAKLLTRSFIHAISVLHRNGSLVIGKDLTEYDGLLETINEIAKSESQYVNEPFEPFTKADLVYTPIKISKVNTISGMLVNDTALLQAVAENLIGAEAEPILSKTVMKDTLDAIQSIDENICLEKTYTIAYKENNVSLQIK